MPLAPPVTNATRPAKCFMVPRSGACATCTVTRAPSRCASATPLCEGDVLAHQLFCPRADRAGMQIVALRTAPELRESVLQRIQLLVVKVLEQFAFHAGGDAQRLGQQLLARRRQAHVENPPVRGARLALDEALALERAYQPDDRLRTHADVPRERRARELGVIAQAKQHEELSGSEIELGQCD